MTACALNPNSSPCRTTQAIGLALLLCRLTGAQTFGGFELSLPGELPSPGPNLDGWEHFSGAAVVGPSGTLASGTSGFPTEGSQWLVVDTFGTGFATPPVLGVPTPPALPLPAGTSARVRKAVTIPAPAAGSANVVLSFKWTASSSEVGPYNYMGASLYDDFVLVDLTNAAGVRVLSLVWSDINMGSFTSYPLTQPVTPNHTGVPLSYGANLEIAPRVTPKLKQVTIPSSLVGQSLYFEINVANALDASYDTWLWIDEIQFLNTVPAPITIAMSQPIGTGTFRLATAGRIVGADSYNVLSLEPAPGGPGTGPYLGLYATNLGPLLAQILAPVGTMPFHFTSASDEYVYTLFGLVPPGLMIEAIAIDVTNGGATMAVTSVASLTTF